MHLQNNLKGDLYMLSTDFNFQEYILNLSQQQLEEFATEAGTTVNYLKRHLIYRKKTPRHDAIKLMVKASNGAFSKTQFIHWLYELKVA